MGADDAKGRDMAKTVVGVLLIAAGNWLAIKGFPELPQVPLASAATSGMARPQGVIAGDLAAMMPKYFKLLMLSLLLVNVGAVSLYLSGEKKEG